MGMFPTSTLSTLIEQIKADPDTDAHWEKLYQRYRPAVYFLVHRLTPEHLASRQDREELVLEVFIRLLRTLRDYEPSKGKFRTWLINQTKAVCKAFRDRTQRRIEGVGETIQYEDSLVLTASTDPPIVIEKEEWLKDLECANLGTALGIAKGQVNQTTYESFVLLVRDGMDAEEVAAKLSISKSSVYANKNRMIDRIRRLKEELDAES